MAVALNYALIGIPQVKLFNLIIFMAGFYAGAYAGSLSGGVAAAAYSIFNPYNLGMFPPLLLLAAQIFCMALIGAVGGYARKFNFLSGHELTIIAKSAVVGLALSLIYNVIVTASGAYLFGTFREAFMLAIPLMLVNVVSNVVSFAVLIPLMIPLKKRFGN